MALTSIGEKLLNDIKNKNVDWNETDPESTSYIMNKPSDVEHNDKLYGRKNGQWEEINLHEDELDFEDFARPYDRELSYQKNQIISYADTLYKAKDDITTPEEFNASHWQEIILSDEIYQKQDKLTETQLNKINNALTDDSKYATKTDLVGKQNTLVFDFAPDSSISGIQTVGNIYQKPYLPGDNIDIIDYTISGKDWTDDISEAVKDKADKSEIPSDYVKSSDLLENYIVNSNIAEKYNNLKTYKTGDFVFRKGILYRAKSDVPSIDVEEVETEFKNYFTEIQLINYIISLEQRIQELESK